MNERIKELAEQAGWMMGDEVEGFNTRLEKFAELIRADEREACAKVCEKEVAYYEELYPIDRPPDTYTSGLWTMAEDLAKSIRARGEVK